MKPIRRRESLSKKLAAQKKADLLHALFERAELNRQAGQSHRQTFKQFSRRQFVNLVSVFRWHRRWLAGGRTPRALLPAYLAGPRISKSAFRQFARLIARQDWPGARAAFVALNRRRKLAISYASFVRWFPVELFRQIQSDRKAVETAQRTLADTRLRADAWIANIPAPLKRQRRSGSHLSMEGAAL